MKPSHISSRHYCWLALCVLVLALLIGLAGCGKKQSQQAADNNLPRTATTPTPQLPTPAVPPTKPIVDITAISRQTPAKVKFILGNPSSSEATKWRCSGTETRVPAISNAYQKDKVEVLFIEGKAARVTVNLSKDEFKAGNALKENLAYIGLIPTDQSVASGPNKVVYSNVNGLYEVSAGQWVGEENGFVLVITDEKYK